MPWITPWFKRPACTISGLSVTGTTGLSCWTSPPGPLPEAVPTTHNFGDLHLTANGATTAVPVLTMIGDQQSALFGYDCRRPGDAESYVLPREVIYGKVEELLDKGGIQLLLRQVPKERLAIALKTASDTMRDLFFSNMSERAAKMLKEDIAALPPMRLRDVDEAQTGMVNTAKDLAAKGEITISKNRGDEELVY
ncbi:MAG: hypothetical protein HC875_16180 [Anaerolineales bacterium]|nr:hypothetical protein [Anaerolineales bacterium]